MEETIIMKVVLDDKAKMPTRAHETDAGLDLYAIEDAVIPARSSRVFDTGVHVQLPENTAGFIKSKSGLNVKHGILADGTIDEGYTGSIRVKLYNNSDKDYKVSAGDKITQLVVVPVKYVGVELADRLEETDRNEDGFGSTGK